MGPETIKLLFFILIVPLFQGCSPYNEGELIQTNLPPKYAFLVIDVQNDFITPNGKLPIDQGQSAKIIKNINLLLPFFDQNKIEVIYIGNEFKKTDTIANWFRNNAAIEGSYGAKPADGLKVINNNYFPKKQPDAFSNQEFDQYLRDKKITKLIISGVFADQCVLSTVKGATNRKYEVCVVSNAIGAKTDKNLNNALEKYHKMNVTVLTSEQLINKMKLEPMVSKYTRQTSKGTKQ